MLNDDAPKSDRSSHPVLGVIADDLTGAADVASSLADEGLDPILIVGEPSPTLEVGPAGAIVIGLQSRTNPPEEAVALSTAAFKFLQSHKISEVFFKYCSTFDSTPSGNIGPVIEALLSLANKTTSIVCPANPDNGRTIYQGHLFVNDQLLSDTSMRHHPLTPMTDSDLRRLLQPQVAHKVGLIPLATVLAGDEAVREAVAQLRDSNVRHVVTDALDHHHLDVIARATVGTALATGATGLASALARALRPRYSSGDHHQAVAESLESGPTAFLCGSCSEMTRRQIARASEQLPSLAMDVMQLIDDRATTMKNILEWVSMYAQKDSFLVYSSGTPEEVAHIQDLIGRDRSAALIESAFAEIAKRLIDMNIDRLVVAGGETSGTVVSALGIESLRIGPQVAPGVPWTMTTKPRPLSLLLKSGNFGNEDLFLDIAGVSHG